MNEEFDIEITSNPGDNGFDIRVRNIVNADYNDEYSTLPPNVNVVRSMTQAELEDDTYTDVLDGNEHIVLRFNSSRNSHNYVDVSPHKLHVADPDGDWVDIVIELIENGNSRAIRVKKKAAKVKDDAGGR